MGETDFLFRKGSLYFLVSEVVQVCWDGVWMKTADFFAQYPDLWLNDLVDDAPKRFTFDFQHIAPEGAIQWLFETHIAGVIPEEFMDSFRPRFAAYRPPARKGGAQ